MSLERKTGSRSEWQHGLRLLLWPLLLLVGLGWLWVAQAQEGQRQAVLLTLQDAIGPATADYVVRGIATAEERRAEVVILQLDTPGGLDSSMRAIIQSILRSDVPVVTYVHPAGARAASAGTYILYGSHVAAMTPSTNLGSATPVQLGGDGGLPGMPSPEGQDEPPSEETPAADEADGEGGEAPRRGKDAMERKVLEDAVAYIRGLAATPTGPRTRSARVSTSPPPRRWNAMSSMWSPRTSRTCSPGSTAAR